MDAKQLQKPMNRLTVCFVAAIASFASLMVFGMKVPAYERTHGAWEVLLGVLVLVWLVSGLGFYVYLVKLARRLGRSWIIWAGLAFITSPIGPFVAYFNMKELVARTLAAPTTVTTSAEASK